MIYDCFLYNGEADQLAMRYEELAPLDPVHVAVIGTRTFQGDEKPPELHYLNTCRCALRRERLRIVDVDDWPDDPDPWEREAHQRNAVVRGIPDAQPDDLVIVSDVDEIPRATGVSDARLLALSGEAVQMRHVMYYFAIDLRCTWGHDYAPVLLRADTLRQIGGQRARRDWTASTDDGGWHFSYLGGTIAVLNKMNAYSHTEFAHLQYDYIASCIAKGEDYDGRGKLEHVPIDDSYPACIRDDPDRWKHLMWENVR